MNLHARRTVQFYSEGTTGALGVSLRLLSPPGGVGWLRLVGAPFVLQRFAVRGLPGSGFPFPPNPAWLDRPLRRVAVQCGGPGRGLLRG
jgi:hypothetical protein